MKKFGLVILGVLTIGVIYSFVVYNSFITSEEVINNQWAQVQIQYQRRFDLIPNLVESVKGVMKQEQAVFNKLAEARSHYAGAATPDDKASAASEVDGALARLLVITENYPQLKSNENVQTLMAQMEGTENRISVERKRYNDVVQNYNIKIKRFPSSVIGKIGGFKEHTYFQSVEGSENAPKIMF